MAQSPFSAQYLASSRVARRAVRPFDRQLLEVGQLLRLLGDLGGQRADLADGLAPDAPGVGADDEEPAEDDGREDDAAATI